MMLLRGLTTSAGAMFNSINNNNTMEISVFKNDQFGILRTVVIDNQPWFIGREVALTLGYNKPYDAVSKHVKIADTTKRGIEDSAGRRQQTILINESGLYSLILGSKLESACEFKHWVTAEVLPQIRQTGGYIPVTAEDDEKTILARAVEILQRTLAKKEALLAEQRPKVVFADAVTGVEDSILIRDLAKLHTRNGVVVGQNRLFAWLRFNGHLLLSDYLCWKARDYSLRS